MPILHSHQSSYELFRGDITGEIAQGDQTQLLDGTKPGYTFQFRDKPAGAWPVDPAGNAVEIIFEGQDVTDNSDFGMNLYGYVGTDGPAERICDISGIFGTARYQDGSAFSGDVDTARYYADTLVISNDDHLVAPVVKDVGANRVAKLQFDAVGYTWLLGEFFDISGAGEAAVSGGAVRAKIRYY